MSRSTILITGISGFIAKQCAVELLNHGYRVRGTVRTSSKGEHVRKTLANHADVGVLEFVTADLTSDVGWNDAVQEVDGILHVASPFPFGQPSDPEALIRTAVDGTIRVLRAAVAANVPRFVQTSSTEAIVRGHGDDASAPFTEEDWTNLDGPHVSAYARSKTLAEQAARTFVKEEGPNLHFSTVNPGLVLGPVMDKESGTSTSFLASFMRGQYPACPKLAFPVVDVRDVARIHRLALETEQPSGGRYIAVAESAWTREIMVSIKEKLGERAARVPTRELPSVFMYVFALFDSAARSALPDIGREFPVDNSETRRKLNFDFIPVSESAPAMAESLLQHNIVG